MEKTLKLYNFSVYAERRDALRKEQAALAAVREVISHLEEPGVVSELKEKVDGWFTIHQDVMKVANLS